MRFNWSAAIALWTILSGPAMYGGPPATPKRAAPVVQPAKSVKSDLNQPTRVAASWHLK
jgi:hypothetical protein